MGRATEYLPEIGLVARWAGMLASVAASCVYTVWCDTTSCGGTPFASRSVGLDHLLRAGILVALLHAGLVASLLAEGAGVGKRAVAALLMLPSLGVPWLAAGGVFQHDGVVGRALVVLLATLYAVQGVRLVRGPPPYRVRMRGA